MLPYIAAAVVIAVGAAAYMEEVERKNYRRKKRQYQEKYQRHQEYLKRKLIVSELKRDRRRFAALRNESYELGTAALKDADRIRKDMRKLKNIGKKIREALKSLNTEKMKSLSHSEDRERREKIKILNSTLMRLEMQIAWLKADYKDFQKESRRCFELTAEYKRIVTEINEKIDKYYN